MVRRHPVARCPVLLLSLFLVGCAGLSAGRGYQDARALVAAGGRDAPDTPGPVHGHVVQSSPEGPLGTTDAIRIALAHNPELRAGYARLGLADAAVYEATRLANPRFDVGWLDGAAGQPRLLLGLAQNVIELLVLAPRGDAAKSARSASTAAVAARLLALAADVESAYRETAGAEARVALAAGIAHAAHTGAALARRFHDAGNLNALALARETAVAAEADNREVAARLAATLARNRLALLLGQGPDVPPHVLADPLAAVPGADPDLAQLQAALPRTRLELAAASSEVAVARARLVVARRTRWLPFLDVGAEFERDSDGSTLAGPTLALELPLFNRGAGRVARARAELDAARASARARRLAAATALANAHATLRATRARVERYRDELLPQQETIVRELALQQAWMLAGQFELIAARRTAWEHFDGYLEALTDYWVARSELARAYGARLPDDASLTPVAVTLPVPDALARRPTTPDAAAPADAGHGTHGDHAKPTTSHDHDHDHGAAKP